MRMKPARITPLLEWEQSVAFFKNNDFSVGILFEKPGGEGQAGKSATNDSYFLAF